MALISHRRRCIDVKVPRCASTTILHWFLEHGGGERSMRPWWHGGMQSERFAGRAEAMNLYQDNRTFTFVRNPYARFVSVWLHANRHAEGRAARIADRPRSHGTLAQCAELRTELPADTRRLRGREARAFRRDHADRRYGPFGIALRRLRFLANHARPQVDDLPDCNPERLYGGARANRDPLCFVGRVETLDADFDRVRRVLGLPCAALGRHNPRAPVSGSERDWASCYDAATRRLVEEIHRADLEFTGCGFDDGRTSPALAAPAGRPERTARRGDAGGASGWEH